MTVRKGLRLARALAMATYRSSSEFATRFDAEPEQNRWSFPVSGRNAICWRAAMPTPPRICRKLSSALSESIDLHRVDATQIHVPTTLVAVREDQLVPLADMQALQARLPVRPNWSKFLLCMAMTRS